MKKGSLKLPKGLGFIRNPVVQETSICSVSRRVGGLSSLGKGFRVFWVFGGLGLQRLGCN